MPRVLILGANGSIAREATTVLRPAWFTSADEVDYETTQKGEPFKGGVVSRKSVAALVVKLATSPQLEVRHSLGVSKPE
jgi:uncharacterized protein YbjT (DUF2867 family)